MLYAVLGTCNTDPGTGLYKLVATFQAKGAGAHFLPCTSIRIAWPLVGRAPRVCGSAAHANVHNSPRDGCVVVCASIVICLCSEACDHLRLYSPSPPNTVSLLHCSYLSMKEGGFFHSLSSPVSTASSLNCEAGCTAHGCTVHGLDRLASEIATLPHAPRETAPDCLATCLHISRPDLHVSTPKCVCMSPDTRVYVSSSAGCLCRRPVLAALPPTLTAQKREV